MMATFMAYRNEVRMVDQYVQKLEKTVRSDQEKCLQGLNIAKMYYEAGEMEESLKYVNKYISVQDRDYRALKLLAQIYSNTGHHIKAINYYKRSLELRGDQHDVVIKIGELYCTMKEGVRPADIKEWLCRVENIDPTHPMVFKLKERLLSSNTSGTDEHFNTLQAITREQLKLCIDDEVLHVKLATLYVKSGSLIDAVLYCQSVNESSVMFGNFKWQLFCLDLYQRYCDSGSNKDFKVHISMLQCMDILLNHLMETKDSQSSTVDLLIKFDMLLQHVIQSDRLVGSEIIQLIDELCGTLYCHCGKYLLSHHHELSLGLACVIAALSVMVPNIRQLQAPPHVIHYWEQATYRRISQCGHIIKFVEKNYEYDFVSSISKVTTAMIVDTVYKGKKWDPGKSFIINEDKFVKLQLQTPSEEELQFCDCEVIRNNPFNLSFLLWVAMCKAEMGISFIVLCVQQLFPHMKTNTNKLSSRCDVGTLCHFDMEAFLVLLLDKLRSDVVKGEDGMKLMISSFLGGLPVEIRYNEFWKNVLKLSNRKTSITVKEEIEKIIAEVRGFKPVRLSIKQLGTLAQHFKKRAEDILEYDDSENVRRLVEALFVNSCHYWKLVIETVKQRSYSPFRQTSQRSKMNNSGGMMLYSKLIDRSASPSDHDSLLDEAFISLGTAALYCKDTSTALLNYEHVKSPQGPYQQCKVYIMMSEKCRVDDPHKSCGLLDKANKCIKEAMQRTDDDSELMEELVEMQQDIVLRMDGLEGVNDSEFYDDIMPVHHYDSEAPLVHSTPAIVNNERSTVTKQSLATNDDNNAIIYAMQKQISDLQKQVALLHQKSLSNSGDDSLSKVTVTPSTTRDDEASIGYTGVMYSSTPIVASDVSNFYQSPHAISSVSQYKNEVPVTVMASESVATSSFTLGNSLSNPGLSSLNFGLPHEDGNNGSGINLLSSHGTNSLVVTSELSSTASYATNFPVSTSAYSTTNIGINLPSFNGNFLQSDFSALRMNLTSSTFPADVTSCSSAPSTSSTPSFGILGNYATTTSTAPTFSSNFPGGVNLFQLPSTSPNMSSLFGETSSSVNTSSTSCNLPSNFSLNGSTSATTVGYSSGTSLFATSSGLSFQINPSALQSIPLSTASSVVSTSTIDSKLFQHFPSLLKITTAAAATTTSSLGASNQLSSDDRDKQDEDDEVEVLNESQPTDDGYTPLVKLTNTYEVKSGEEDEKELFSNRGKLYRYDQPTKAWKERGIGAIKILQHNVTSKVRVLMRREHILKICCNHYITGEMELAPLVGNNTSWTWITLSDFSDEEAKVEKLCIRFKQFEVAQTFKTIFTDCIQKVKHDNQRESDSGNLSVKLGGTTLSVLNQPTSVGPAVTIQSSTVTAKDTVESEHSSYNKEDVNDDDDYYYDDDDDDYYYDDDDDDDDDDDYEEDEEEEDSDIDVDSGLAASSEMTTANLAAKFSRKPGNWECDVCFVSNEKDISQCIACANTNPNITIPKSSTDISSTTTTATATAISSSFGSGFKLSVNLPIAQPSQPANTVVGFKLGNQSSGGIKLSSLIAGATNSNTASSSSDSIFKLPVSLPTAQASEPTTTAGELKLDCRSSGGFKLGGLSIISFPSKQPAAVTVQSSDECVVTGELKPSKEEIELAQNFMLPPMFYNYKTKPPCPGCIGCEDDSDVPTTSDADTLPSVATSTSATGSMLFGTSGGKLQSFGMPSGLSSTSATTAPVLFGASDSGLQSFASLANATEFQFGREASKKGFAGAGTMLFQSQKEDSEENINPETELDVDFKPLVSLPDTYQVTTGQESEEQLFCERAKLYRYDPNSKQWKERGIGNMTIMKNRESGKSRLVMRREQVLKLCCNHVILPTMQLNPMVGGGNAWRWFTPCDFSEEESKPEQLAIRFKRKEQADSFQEVFLRCIQEGTEDATNKDDFISAHTEEQQFSADIKFYQFQMDNKLWERKGNGKVVIIKMSSGSQIMRVVDTNDSVFYEQVLSSTCKLGQFPTEEKSWTWRYTRSNSTEVTRYAIRFIELSDCNQFKQLVSDYVVTIVPPHTPRSPEIPPLSPASSDGGSPCQRRPLIEAIKSIGIWSCNNCNTNNPGSESQCMVCDAEKSTPPLLSPTGMQSNNPFFSGGKPVDYNVSSLTSSILSLSNSTAGSDVRSYTPFSNIGLLQRQQGDSESDGPPSLVSVPSQESSSAVSFEQKHEVTKSLFKMPTFTISETKVSFPLLDSTRSDNFSSINSTQSDKEEEHPETEANVFFDPVVSLPSDFDNKSGEENEECVFIHRAKLYRFNNEVKMWKERGIGNIKILKHKTSGKGRILMRREQVLKLCCNHYIVSGMTLKPGSSPDRSWMWFTSADYSEEVTQPEMFFVKFKDPEIASTFKKIFYTFATNTESLIVKPADLTPEPSEDDVVCTGEELPEQQFINLAQQYMLPHTFYNYLKKCPCTGCRGCIDEEMECEVVPSNINIVPTVTVPEVKQDNVLLFSSGSETVSFADLASAAKSTGGFGGSELGISENKGFAGAGKPLFSSQTEKENDTLGSFEPTAEFKPIVKLSSDVKLQSGEEDEIVLFSHRAKLYRFDPSGKQWKERGTGDIKILKHKKTGKCRILMRRDQILKLCCNHWIAKGMILTVRDEKVLQWMTLSDFSDEEARAEQFSVRFKLADTARSFQQIFNDCLSNVDSAEGTSLNIQQSFAAESTLQATNSSCNPPNTVNNRVTSSYDSTATSTVTTVEEHAGVNSCSAAMAAALIFPSVTTGSALSATLPTVNSNVTSSYDTTTTFTVNTVKEHPSITSVSAAMTTAGIFPSVNTSSAIQSTADNSAITSITTFTVNTIKEQLSVTTSSATVTTSLIFPSVTTSSAIQPTVDNNVTTSCDAITTFTVNTIKEQPSVTSISTAMTAALSATNSSAMHSTVNSIVTSSYDTTTTFTVNTVKGSSAAMTTAEIFPSATTSSAIQPTVDSSVIASTTAFTVNTIKEQPSVTTSDAAVTSALTFPPVTTGITTNPALFVFGSSSDKPSKPVSPPKFSFTPKTDAFNFSLKPASSVPNIFRLSNSGAFNFPMKSATSIPSVFDNKVVSFLRPREKEPDYEVDSQNEEWVTESESECLGSEHSLERSEDYEDEANSEHIGSSINNTLTDDIDSSITSVGTLVDQQEGVSLVTKYHSQVHDDSSGDSGETQQQ